MSRDPLSKSGENGTAAVLAIYRSLELRKTKFAYPDGQSIDGYKNGRIP
jgi:hypothetical protein